MLALFALRASLKQRVHLAQVVRPKRYFTEVNVDNLGSPEDEESVDCGQEEVQADSHGALGSSSPWPEFIHLPEDTDSE